MYISLNCTVLSVSPDLQGYHRRHQYVVTQGPMNNTITDFWRMIWEHRCSCIIMLCPLEEMGKVSGPG